MKAKKLGLIKVNLIGLKIIFQAKPLSLIVYIILSFIHGMSYVLQVIAMQYFIDTVTQIGQQPQDPHPVYLSLLLMGAAYLFSQIMNGLFNCFGQILNTKIGLYVNQMLIKKIGELPNIEFEDVSRLNQISKAVNGKASLFWVSMTLIDIVFFYLTYFLFMGWYLFTLKPVLGLSIIIIFIPCIISRYIEIGTSRKLEDLSASIRRKYEYFERCISDKEYFKETRLLGAVKFFYKLYVKELKLLNRYLFTTQLKKTSINFAMKLITVLGFGSIIYMLFVFVMRGEISIGSFSAVLTSLSTIYSFMNEAISERLSIASGNCASAESYLLFVGEETSLQKTNCYSDTGDIVLKNVSFQYPSSQHMALNKINLNIHKGETLAFVGENGSGKTTLSKIILGLYKPTEGQIFHMKPTGELPENTNASSVFQKFIHYKMTLRDNIQISQLNKVVSDEQLLDFCDQAELVISDKSALSSLDTMLSRDFDGIELSGGQWQRVAIARGLYKDSDLIILDEPTAAIDPLEETRLYNNFSKICKGKTAIIITHRLGISKIADRIAVLKDGEVVQLGSHHELINIDGEYQKMYLAQQQWYKE